MLVLELLEHDRETYIVPDYMNRYRAWLAFNRLSSRLVFPFGPIFAQFSIGGEIQETRCSLSL